MTRWLYGPVWLLTKDWPPQFDLSTGVFQKITLEEPELSCVMTVQVAKEEGLGVLIPLDCTNSYTRLIDKTAGIVMAWKKWRKEPITRIESRLWAEKRWIADAQRTTYRKIIEQLLDNKNNIDETNCENLRVYLDQQQLLRVRSRLTDDHNDGRYGQPIILHGAHRLTELLIQHVHETNLHAGLATTLKILRQQYWVPRGRQVVRKVIRQCVVCLRWSRLPVQQPVAALPSFRAKWSDPFVHVGIDFAGPVFLSEKDQDQQFKGYIVLFSCAVSRAIHLEATRSLSVDEFCLAFRRFASRRGLPSVVYSDNATTFKRSSRVLTKAKIMLTQPQLQRYFEIQNIQWRFIVEKAPWWGGFWERMVRSVKEPLRKTLRRTSIDYVTFTTILVEIEAAINSRPLTMDYDDAEDPRPITPAQLIIGRPLQALDLGEQRRPSDGSDLQWQAKERKRLGFKFQRRWVEHYIAFLRSAHIRRQNEPVTIKEGQIFLLSQAQQKRQLWPIIRVTQVYPGRDGVVRSCQVRMADGRVFRRPVNLLVPLEMEESEKGTPLPGPRGVLQEVKDDDVGTRTPELLDEVTMVPRSPMRDDSSPLTLNATPNQGPTAKVGHSMITRSKGKQV